MPFQSGDNWNGNANGRPPGTKNFTTKVREALEKIAEGKDYTYEEAFIKSILKKAIVDGDTSMMRTIWEQLDGKPLQRIAGEVGEPLEIIVKLRDANKKPENS